jgi:hypothetical protein
MANRPALIFWTVSRLQQDSVRRVRELGLAPSDADHRRVLAVLRYLEP